MPVLAQRSFFSRPHPIIQRSSRRSQQGTRSSGMEIPDFCHRNTEFSWFSGILPSIYPRFLKDRKANDISSSEGSQVYLDIKLRSSFPAVEDFVDLCTYLDPA